MAWNAIKKLWKDNGKDVARFRKIVYLHKYVFITRTFMVGTNSYLKTFNLFVLKCISVNIIIIFSWQYVFFINNISRMLNVKSVKLVDELKILKAKE